MTEKRKPSTRNRGEPPLKKRLPTPTPPPIPSEPVEEGLPVRLKDDQELPTFFAPQERDLPIEDYQSVSERLNLHHFEDVPELIQDFPIAVFWLHQ